MRGLRREDAARGRLRVWRIGLLPQRSELREDNHGGRAAGGAASLQPLLVEAGRRRKEGRMMDPHISDAPDLRVELAERMQCIKRLATYIADDDCEDCDGAGVDHEGAEWTICGCVMEVLG
jgi:hypothetical protein